MASNLDYVFDPYVVDGFVDDSYVNDPYLAGDYVSQAIIGSAALAASASLSVQGSYLQQGTSSLTATANQSSSAERIRAASSNLSAAFTLTVDADVERHGTSSSSGVFSVQASAVKTIDATASTASAFSTTNAAIKTANASITVDSALSATLIGNAIVSPGGNFVMSSSTSTSAVKTADASATLSVGQPDVYWQDDISWDSPWDTIWGPGLQVTQVVKIVSGSITIAAQASVSADGDRTSVATITVDSFASFEAAAGTEKQASATLSSSSSVSAIGTKDTDTSIILSPAFSLQASGIFQVAGYPEEFVNTATVNVDAVKTAVSSATLESSRDAKTISKYVGTNVSTDQARFGTKSLYIASLFQYITVPADAKFGIGDFTVDMWIYKSNITTGTYTLFDNRSSGDGLVVRISSNRIGVLATGDSVITYSATTNFTNSTWHHVAFTRSGTTLTVYVDGTAVITHTVVDNNWNYTAAIGNLLTSPVGFTDGYIDEVRFSTGLRYTTNFTSPTAAFETDSNTRFLFHADNGFVDDSVIHNVSISANRIRAGSSTFNSVATLNANADRVGSGIILVASSGTLSINGDRIASGKTSISTSASITKANGGKLTGGIVTMQGFFAQLSALTIYNIDPYRVFTINPETRLLEILQETRIYTPIQESRVNTVLEETRGYTVPSETRTIEVQPLVLVEVEGNPLDRRTG